MIKLRCLSFGGNAHLPIFRHLPMLLMCNCSFGYRGILQRYKILPWCGFFAKSLRTLFVLMMLICLIALCLSAVMERNEWTNLPCLLALVLTGFHSYDSTSGCSAMWFVYTLMIIRVIHNLTACKYRLQFFISTVFLSLAILFNRLGIDVANAWVDLLLAYPFFFIGNICDNANSLQVPMKQFEFSPLLQCLIVMFLTLVVYCISEINGIVYM
mgnify:FL=1